MKRVFLLIVLLAAVPAFAQEVWQKVDTVTSGDFDDSNPVLDRGGTAWYDSGPLVHWLIFERKSETSSSIVAKRFFHTSKSWDTTNFLIASMPPSLDLSHPIICTNSTGYCNADSTWMTYSVLSAWEVSLEYGREIYYSRFDAGESVWGPIIALTADSIDNSSPRIFPWNDSTFALIWKRGRALVYSLISSSQFSTPDTILSSNLDDFEFDLISLNRRYLTPGEPIVWTVQGSNGYRTLAATSLEIDSTIRAAEVDTLQFGRDASDPSIYDNLGWSSPTFFFTSVDSGRPQTYSVVWNSCTGEWLTAHSMFEGDSASNINFSGWERVLIVDEWPLTASNTVRTDNMPGGFLAWERETPSDTSVIFHGFKSDTLSSLGYDMAPSLGTYSFQVLDKLCNMMVWASDRTGRSHIYSRIFPWMGTDAVKNEPARLQQFQLRQNYPNPFNPSTTISYRLSAVSRVDITVYDVLGRKVKTLIDGRQTPGEHSVTFDGRGLASGVYFYRLSAGSYVTVKKMLLLK